MEKLFEQAIEACLKGLYGEGRRYVRVKAYSLVVQIIDGMRKAILLQYCLISACFLWTLGFFTSGYLLFEHWETLRQGAWPAPLSFTLTALGLATLVLGFTVNQRLWIRVLGVQGTIRGLSVAGDDQRPRDFPSESELAALIERAVDRAVSARGEHETSARNRAS